MNSSTNFYKMSASETLSHFKVDKALGLSLKEVTSLQETYGENTLTKKSAPTNWKIFIRQLKSVIVFLLLSAALVSSFLGQWIEATSIFTVLVINTLIGFITEYKAVSSMESLRLIGRTTTNVLRDGFLTSVSADKLVPGDIVILEAGDMVTADMRIIECSKLSVDESILTGESVAVEKKEEALSEDAILAERNNMLFKGTFLTRGTAKALVVATAMQTEIGKITKITQEASEESTPLEERLDKLGQQLVWISLLIGVIVALSGLISGKPLLLMFKTAVALAISTIPEGLPIVATMALAKGMWRMAGQNALVNKLSAVETLGATSIIFTDKTGTLTENKMVVNSFYIDQGLQEIKEAQVSDPSIQKSLEIGVLCNNASIEAKAADSFIGDPMEVALLNVGKKFGLIQSELLKKYPQIREEAFDPHTRMMATFHQDELDILVAVKGAPESVFKASSQFHNESNEVPFEEKLNLWLERNQEMANNGLRVLALAYKRAANKDEDPYKNLTFVGLVGISDPARPEIKNALAKCQSAGIRIIMVTGDQAGTAKKIAKDINLVPEGELEIIRGDELGEKDLWSKALLEKLNSISIFSRVSPQQKLDLIQHYQQQNHVVAMTGDGVNDAPALRKADIGVAMGLRGTQVAREAADMVLKDDSFNTIVMAIEQGRVIFSNIKRFVLYLLSCNISEVLIVSLASIINAPLPILPLQILFLNLVTDVFPALALGMGEGDKSYLERPPRVKSESVLEKEEWKQIAGHGLVITTSVLLVFFYIIKGPNAENAVTVAFLTLGFAQVFHVFNMRQPNSKFLVNEITRNPHIWGAILICTFLLLAAVYIPGLAKILSLNTPTIEEWYLIAILSLIPLFIGQLALLLNPWIQKKN